MAHGSHEERRGGLHHRGWRIDTIPSYATDAGSVGECSLEVADEHWRISYIVAPSRVAFITYTCAAADAEVERSVVDEIVRSFRWITSRN